MPMRICIFLAGEVRGDRRVNIHGLNKKPLRNENLIFVEDYRNDL